MDSSAEQTIARLMRAFDVHDEGALAIQLGRDAHTLRVWRNRDAVPLPILVHAAQATGYSLAWLRGEEGAAAQDAPRTPDDDAAQVSLSPREAQLIDRYRSTDEEGRAAVELVTSTLATGAKPGGKAAKSRRANPPKAGGLPAVEGLQLALLAREGDAPWRSAGPVRADTHRSGDGRHPAAPALLPISSASESRPLVLTIKGGSAGKSKDYEVIPKFQGGVSAGTAAPRNKAIDRGLDLAGEMAFSEDWLRHNLGHTSGQLASMRVHGDSMAPTLVSGETILIDTAVRRVDVSGIYVIEAHGDRLVKRIDRKLDASLMIISDNPAYPPEVVPSGRLDDITVVGRLVGRWQR